MKHFVKIAVGFAVLIGLCSCDLFLAEKAGHWNPLDPDYDPAEKTLTPAIDGFIYGDSGGYETYNRMFSSQDLQIDYFSDGLTGGICCTLIRFDLGTFPDSASVDHAILNLTVKVYSEYITSDTPIEICRIGQQWDPSSVEMATVLAAPFISGTYVSGYIPKGAIDRDIMSVDVTPIMQDWLSGIPNYGLMIRVPGTTGYEISCYASEAGAQGPALEVAYTWIP